MKPHPVEIAVKPSEQFGFGSATATNVPMTDLAGQLSLDQDRPVLDHTGLKDRYDFALHWTPTLGEGRPEAMGLPPHAEAPRLADPGGPSIFTALQEQLGLKLKTGKAPVEILVVDNVARPSEN
jgi:uncharacterized protein (TIGR03435 family)